MTTANETERKFESTIATIDRLSHQRAPQYPSEALGLSLEIEMVVEAIKQQYASLTPSIGESAPTTERAQPTRSSRARRPSAPTPLHTRG